MDVLFRPERGGFLLLRVVAGLLTLVGVLLTLVFLALGPLMLLAPSGRLFAGPSLGALIGQITILLPMALSIAAAGHLLRALALYLAGRFKP